MNNSIQQIKNIPGVKVVEAAGENMAVVVFEGDKENDLLAEAKRRYPKGTRFVSAYDSSFTGIVDGYYLTVDRNNVRANCTNGNLSLYLLYDGKWAEIIPQIRNGWAIPSKESGRNPWDELREVTGNVNEQWQRFDTKEQAVKYQEIALIEECEKRFPIGSKIMQKCFTLNSFKYKPILVKRPLKIKKHNGNIDYVSDSHSNVVWTNSHGFAEPITKEPEYLKPEELEDGEIYFDGELMIGGITFSSRIIRQKENGIASQVSEFGHEIPGTKFPSAAISVYRYGNVTHATPKQKSLLIKAEIEHGYMWDDKKKELINIEE